MKRILGDTEGDGKLTLGDAPPPTGGAYALLRGGGGATTGRRQRTTGSVSRTSTYRSGPGGSPRPNPDQQIQ